MKKLNFFAVVAAFMLITTAYAEELVLRGSDFSQRYIDYMELSEEERKGLIEPFPVDIVGVSSPFSMFSVLPEKYDIRETDYKITVRNQQNTESCWAFSATSNLSAYLKKNGENEFIFSPRHMENQTAQNPDDLTNIWAFGAFNSNNNVVIKPRPINSGGNASISTAYFMNGNGPVLESDMPFKNDVIPENTAALHKPVAARVLDYEYLPTDSSTAMLEAIKKSIYNNGSASINILWNNYYCNSNGAYYNPNPNTKINHAILAVGWDDNYPKENFKYQPPNDGALIIQNSWGENTGDNGYYYISYYEMSIYSAASTVLSAEKEIEYDNRYIHDPLGWNGWRYYTYENSDMAYHTVYGANVFKKPEGTEELTEVTFGNNGATGYIIYVNPTNGSLNNL